MLVKMQLAGLYLQSIVSHSTSTDTAPAQWLQSTWIPLDKSGVSVLGGSQGSDVV